MLLCCPAVCACLLSALMSTGDNAAQSPYNPGDGNYDYSGYSSSSAVTKTVGYAPSPGNGDGGQGEVMIEW